MEYTFKCSKCNKRFDVVGDFNTVAFLHPSCPDCGSKEVSRKYDLSFILKGKGFYKNDKK